MELSVRLSEPNLSEVIFIIVAAVVRRIIFFSKPTSHLGCVRPRTIIDWVPPYAVLRLIVTGMTSLSLYRHLSGTYRCIQFVSHPEAYTHTNERSHSSPQAVIFSMEC